MGRGKGKDESGKKTKLRVKGRREMEKEKGGRKKERKRKREGRDGTQPFWCKMTPKSASDMCYALLLFAVLMNEQVNHNQSVKPIQHYCARSKLKQVKL